jgi:NAD(P)H-quinone oxidoreductase subunit 5
VSDAIQNQYVGKSQPSLGAWLAAAGISISIITSINIALATNPPFSPWILIAIALTVSLAIRLSQLVSFALLKGVADALMLAALYVLLKFGAGSLLPQIAHTYKWQADTFIGALFIGVLAVYLFLEYLPQHKVSRKLFIALNAGFYLDEWSTRFTLRVWPIHLPKQDVKIIAS